MTDGREVATVRKICSGIFAVSFPHSAATKREKHSPFCGEFAKKKKGRVFFMQKSSVSTRKVTLAAMFLALDVLMRYLSAKTELIQISLTFVPTSLCAMTLGPVYAGITAFFGDLLGFFLKPIGYYFPGLGISAALYGISFGLFFYRRKKSFVKIFLCVLLTQIVIGIGLNTIWFTYLGQPFIAAITARSIQALTMIVVQPVGIFFIWKYIGTYINKHINL